MTISLVVTMSVSLLLASLGLLIQAQAERTEKYFGDRLQLQVNLCTQELPRGHVRRRSRPPTTRRRPSKTLSTTTPRCESFERGALSATTSRRGSYLGQTDDGRKQLETLGPDSFPAPRTSSR